MIRGLCTLSLFYLTACAPAQPEKPDFGITPENIRSGYDFLTAETQALQDDDFSNPGFLWVEKGQDVFANTDQGQSCASCHTDPDTSFQQTALRYPAIDSLSGDLVNLEGRINLCRTRHQKLTAHPYESEELLALTTYVKSFARGQTGTYAVGEKLQTYFDAGKAYFHTQRGQLNLSCHQCHDQNWGKQMRGETVSQGHINGFPTSRNDWQTLGSAHRRFETCDTAVRAQPHPLGSDIYTHLEVYLMARGQGLEVETPSIRR